MQIGSGEAMKTDRLVIFALVTLWIALFILNWRCIILSDRIDILNERLDLMMRKPAAPAEFRIEIIEL